MSKLINDKDREELLKIKNPKVKILLDFYDMVTGDSGGKYYLSVIEVVGALSKEMGQLAQGKGHSLEILQSEDKTFERVLALLTNNKKIFAGINKGRNYVIGEEKKEDKSLTKGSSIPL